mgnify:CR=1 FL=1
MPLWKPNAAEIAKLRARVEEKTEDEQLQDNYFFHGLYSLSEGLYANKPPANLWVKTEAGEWKRLKRKLSRREWIESFFMIRTKSGKIEPLKLNRAQRRLEAWILRMERAGVPVRIQILKARQLGFSTYIQAVMFHASLRGDRVRSLIVADNRERSETLLQIAEIARTCMPKSKDGDVWEFKMKSAATKSLVWTEPIGSEIRITSAEAPQPGRGGTRTMAHLCLAPTTPVLVDDGRILKMRDVPVGARVVTHTGAEARIVRITCSRPDARNGNGETVKITPWLGGEIELTPNHPVWTERGWVRADSLRVKDRVSMPVRKITSETTHLTMPKWVGGNLNGSGSKALAMGEKVALTREFGFTVGYYLAEGHVVRQGARYSAISFAHHRNEGAYADRACAGVSGLFRSRRTNHRDGCLTTTDIIYSTSLATLFAQEFGAKDEKRIPDWVFTAGVEFASGLLAGYLSGDGSKQDGFQGKYRLSTMCATSIRSSLSVQARDLAAALGFGWANIDHKPAGVRHGRNEREAWTCRWTGRAARALRALVGLDTAGNGQQFSEKSEFKDGLVWLGIRKIERGRTDEVYDVEVDHEDHSFRTLHFSVKNSEGAFWPDAHLKQMGILASVPSLPGTYVFDESTANGDIGTFRDGFWDAWHQRAIPLAKRINPWHAEFYAWWEHDEYYFSKSYGLRTGLSKELEAEILATLNDEENWLLKQTTLVRWTPDTPWEEVVDWHTGEKKWRRVGVGPQPVSIDQLAWRRFKIADKEIGGDINRFNQEYPSRPEVAFLASGRPVFDTEIVGRYLNETADPIAVGWVLEAAAEDEPESV